MPPKRRQQQQQRHPRTKVFSGSVTVKGLGTFKSHQNGSSKHWSSHHAAIVFKVKIEVVNDASQAEVDWDAVEKHTFKQKPRVGGDGATGGSWVKPTFKDAELQRMALRAKTKLSTALGLGSGQQQQQRPPQEEDFEEVDAEEAEAENKSHEVSLCERCQSSGYPCTGVIEVLAGVYVRVKGPKVLRNRHQRLQQYGLTTLYHQTDATAARLILRSQKMLRGGGGALGGGIYFAATAAETAAKARSRGVILKCQVLLGNARTVGRFDGSITFSSLVNRQFDSVVSAPGLFNSGLEFVVYNSDQVVSIVRN